MKKDNNIELLDGIIHINGIGLPFLNPLEFDKIVAESEMAGEFFRILDLVIDFSKKYERNNVRIELLNNNLHTLTYDFS